jgi:hypothetical protein
MKDLDFKIEYAYDFKVQHKLWNKFMKKITSVTIHDHYRLQLVFNDGVQGIVDLTDLVGKGVFSSWCDAGAFEQVEIGSCGELVWDDQIDLCPDSLYLKVTGKSPEDLFPMLKHESAHA